MMLLALLLLAADPPASPAQIEQLAPAAEASAQADNLGESRPDPRVSQLPPMLAPIEGTTEDSLQRPAAAEPVTGWTAEVLRALEIIRSRGQQPTPELIAREISPEALQAYLDASPDLKGTLVTPEALPPPLPRDVPSGAGVTIVPPSGG